MTASYLIDNLSSTVAPVSELLRWRFPSKIRLTQLISTLFITTHNSLSSVNTSATMVLSFQLWSWISGIELMAGAFSFLISGLLPRAFLQLWRNDQLTEVGVDMAIGFGFWAFAYSLLVIGIFAFSLQN
jgi:hypothetical protein